MGAAGTDEISSRLQMRSGGRGRRECNKKVQVGTILIVMSRLLIIGTSDPEPKLLSEIGSSGSFIDSVNSLIYISVLWAC